MANEQSVDQIVKSLNIKNLDWILSYQSRVGRKWIGASTEDIIVENSKLENTLFWSSAFVSEHSGALVELDIEYKDGR